MQVTNKQIVDAWLDFPCPGRLLVAKVMQIELVRLTHSPAFTIRDQRSVADLRS